VTVHAWSPDRRVSERRTGRWRRRGVERRQASAYLPAERRRRLPDRRAGT